MTRSTLCAAALLLLARSLPAAAPAAGKDGIAFFEAKVRPVLIQHCYSCHSLDAQKARKVRGGLLLDTKRGLREGGDSGPAIVPGKSADSLLVKMMRQDGSQMPPRGKLPASVIADIARWIDMGAPDPRDGTVLPGKRNIDIEQGKRFWSFRPLALPALPAVKDRSWVRTPVDRFILSRLEARGLQPAGALLREKLIRRATFDLTGLPPTPEEVDAFVQDGSPGAYDRLLDRLLSSERHGERWARHWLDVARFAESGGYEFDGDRPGAYHYRDFVIRALNADMPFDEFVRLQLAGDELKQGDLVATAATGFLVAAPYPGQTTAKTLEPIRYDHLDDMISTIGTGLLGLSLGCARCHEHKYDPVPQQDYYRLIANLARTDSLNRKMDPDPEAFRKRKAAFDVVHAPFLAARDRYEKEELPGKLAKWLAGEKGKPAPEWLTLEPTSATAVRGAFEKLPDGSLLATGKAEPTSTYTFIARTGQKSITAIRLEAMSDSRLPGNGPGRGPAGNFCLTTLTVAAAPLDTKKGKGEAVKLDAKKATFEQAGHALAGAVDADAKTGWSVGGATGKSHAALFTPKKPIGFDGGTMLTITLAFQRDFPIGRFRLAISTAKEPKIDGPARPQHGPEIVSLLGGKDRSQLLHWFRAVDPGANAVLAAIEQSAKNEPKPPLVDVFAATSGRGGDVHYLIRGETERKNGVARPGFAQVLMAAPEESGRWLRTGKTSVPPRVALANWITDPVHGAGHLLARVIVNRLWQHHFGKGIVRTPNDFGAQGDPPTHPELLDYLASELIRNGWKLKPIHKLLMTSAVYLQSGEVSPAAMKEDPRNLLWSHVPPRRLEAEAIRDSLLAVGGSLQEKKYGPGTLDENDPRRSIYLTVKRTRLIPLLQTFDAPEAIGSVGERQVTTATTQALAMMNSPFVRREAQKLAARVQGVSAVEKAYRIALGRRPSAAEASRMTAFLRRLADETKDPAGRQAATADFCQMLLCLNEFIYID
jgi:hypothetical protein